MAKTAAHKAAAKAAAKAKAKAERRRKAAAADTFEHRFFTQKVKGTE